MPEINRRNAFTTEVLKTKKRPFKHGVDEEVIGQIAEDYNVEFIGRGCDRFVFTHPHDSEKLIAVEWTDYVQRDRAKKYFNNLFALLFPHNIPYMYASFHYPDQIHDYIHEATYMVGDVRRRIRKGAGEIVYPFQNVIELSQKYHLPLHIDNVPQNFLVGKDGGEYYVDHLPRPDTVQGNNFLEYLQDSNREEDIIKARHFLERIASIKRG